MFVTKRINRIPFERPMYSWEDIKRDLNEIGYKGVNWIHLAQDRV
jgi:maltoporin